MNVKAIARISLVLLIATVCLGQNVQLYDVLRIKSDLKSIIVNRKVAHMVRAVFHDCVGGCDGCLNRNNLFNQGCNDGTNWIETVNELDSRYDSQYASSGLSRADIYVLAAEAGIENAVDLANDFAPNSTPMPEFNFRYGRIDCSPDGQTSTNRNFPSGHLDADGVFSFFGNEFGMDVAETVAIMGGGHTLGGSTGFTGWIGFWKGVGQAGEDAGNRFNNDYYKFLVNSNFDYLQQSVPQQPPLCSGFDRSPRFQWNSFQNNVQQSFALNADMAMLKDIIVNSATGQSCCTYDSCADSAGACFVRRFACNAQAFIDEFEIAWEKMSTAGGASLQTPECSDAFDFCGNYASYCEQYEALRNYCPLTCGVCQV